MRRKITHIPLFAIALIIAICSAQNQVCAVATIDTSKESTVIATLFHEPYLQAADIRVNSAEKREKLMKQMEEYLEKEPSCVTYNAGSLFKRAHYSASVEGGGYYFYGSFKNNRPSGFGVLVLLPVGLDKPETWCRIIYAGEFKRGYYNGYGAEFKNNIWRVGPADENFYLNAYSDSHVVRDGVWKKGKPNGKMNEFNLLTRDNEDGPENYWAGSLYPDIRVTDEKNGKENGNAAWYVNGYLVYEGKVKNGVQSGKGSSYYYGTSQVEYKGKWKKGYYHGKGTLYDKSGKKIYSGKWSYGNYAS